MDRQKRQKNLNARIQDILMDVNYNIHYVPGENGCTITSTLDNNEYDVKFIPTAEGSGVFESSYKNIKMTIPEWSKNAMSFAILNEVCKSKKYPLKYVPKAHKIALSNDPLSDKESNLLYLIEDIYHRGVTKEHIEIAKENGVWAGLSAFLNLYLEIPIAAD